MGIRGRRRGSGSGFRVGSGRLILNDGGFVGLRLSLLTSAATIKELGAVGAAAEEVVGFVEDELTFEVLELAVGGEDGSGLAGFDGVVVVAEGENFAVQATQGGDEFGVGLGIFGNIGGREGGEQGEEMAGGELEAGFGQFGGVGISEEVGGGILGVAEDLEAFLGGEVVLVAAVFPTGKVLLGDWPREGRFGGGQGFDDGGIGCAVVEEGVDAVAERFGEAGDFAFAAGGLLNWGFRVLIGVRHRIKR